MMFYPPEDGWAAAWSNGAPHPFIIISTVSNTRKDAIKHMVDVWRRDGETPKACWQRVYRAGCRIIRVCVTHEVRT